MTEGEGSFRERRSAHASEEQAPAAPAAEVVTPPPAEAPTSGVSPETEAAETRGREKVPEGPFFDVVQYIVLRASQCLGEIPFDETGQQRVLPREAKEYIDLLASLRERTRDDLSKEAIRALDGVLTDLRTRYLGIT